MKSISRLLFSIFLLLSILTSQSASEAIRLLENEMGFGARSLGMGGANIALGDDPSDMYWNPAGLAGIINKTFYIETNNLNYNNNTTYLDQTTNNPLQKFGQFNGFGISLVILNDLDRLGIKKILILYKGDFLTKTKDKLLYNHNKLYL